jgi:hypothetical protein
MQTRNLPPSPLIAVDRSSRHFSRTASVVFEEAGGNDVCIFFSFSLSFDSTSLVFSSFSLDFFELPAVSLLLGVFGPYMKCKLESYKERDACEQ